MSLSRTTKLFAGLSLILVPTIEFGGTFLLSLLSGESPELEFTEFQRAMFRAGHAHAGVLVTLSIVCQLLADHVRLPNRLTMAARIGMFAAPLLISGGFFGGASTGPGDRPGGLIALLWIGVFVLGASVLTLGVGLLRARRE